MQKVTIMIPTYNQSVYIGQAIESAMKIDYPNLEIVISDDFSTDNTQEVVKQYLSDERVKYYKNEQNLGRVGNYRKTLYDYATGDYVLNLDGDDWLLETDFIVQAVKLFEKNENMSCVLGDRQNYDEIKNQYRTFSNKDNPYVKEIMNGNEFFINMSKSGFVFSHLAVLYRKDLAMSIGFYNKDILSSDSESINRLYLNHEVGYVPVSVGVWRVHQANVSHENLGKKMENIKKYDYLFEYAREHSPFDKYILKNWLLENQSGTLAQDVLYYLKHKQIILAIALIKRSFSKDKELGLKVFCKSFKRGIGSLYA